MLYQRFVRARKNIGYIRCGTICSFRHLLVVWNVSLADKGGAGMTVLKCTQATCKDGKYHEEN